MNIKNEKIYSIVYSYYDTTLVNICTFMKCLEQRNSKRTFLGAKNRDR